MVNHHSTFDHAKNDFNGKYWYIWLWHRALYVNCNQASLALENTFYIMKESHESLEKYTGCAIFFRGHSKWIIYQIASHPKNISTHSNSCFTNWSSPDRGMVIGGAEYEKSCRFLPIDSEMAQWNFQGLIKAIVSPSSAQKIEVGWLWSHDQLWWRCSLVFKVL